MFDLSLGIMAYNEEGGIGRLLDALLKEAFVHARLKEIVVVASGCTDRTEAIVRDFMKNEPRIHLIAESQRKGKASAINHFLSTASGDICVLESADTRSEAGAIDKLVAPFAFSGVGMTGGRPIPVNPTDTFIGYAVNLMWSLHHAISLTNPKLGELIAFRNFIKKIPEDTAVDEASIEAIVTQAGYQLRYVPEAVVRNKGPENIKEFIRQRRRIAAGHKHLLKEEGYQVNTMDLLRILKTLIQWQSWKVKDIVWTLVAISLEAAARVLGNLDLHVRKQVPVVWEISTSTKTWN